MKPAITADQFDTTAATDYYKVATENLLENSLVQLAAETINRTGGNVLDIGCGRGAFSQLLDKAIDYTGFDLSLEAKDIRHDSGRCIVQGDACCPYPYRDASFQYVVSFWCIEHLPDPRTMLREAVRVLAPGGTIFFVFPNYDNPLRRCPSWWCDRGLSGTVSDDSLTALRQSPRPSRVFRQVWRRTSYFIRQFSKQVWIDLTRSPVFEINHDPAYKHLPWARDRDAIHIASGRSVVLELRRLGLSISHVAPGGGVTRLPVVGSLFRRLPEYAIEASKRPAESGTTHHQNNLTREHEEATPLAE